MKFSMKKFLTGGALAIFIVAVFSFAAPTHASAAVSWNNSALGPDCPTVGVANYTKGTGFGNPCWATSVAADPGDVINVRVYYHNTGNSSAPNTTITLGAPLGSSSGKTFTASVSGGGANASGSGTVTLSSAETITYG